MSAKQFCTFLESLIRKDGLDYVHIIESLCSQQRQLYIVGFVASCSVAFGDADLDSLSCLVCGNDPALYIPQHSMNRASTLSRFYPMIHRV